MERRPAAPDQPAPKVAILGSFALTGAPLSLHAAQIHAIAAAAGHQVIAISPLPGAFAVTDLRAALASRIRPDLVIVYPRTLLRPPPGEGLRGVIRQLRRTRRLMAAAPAGMAIMSRSGLLERLAALIALPPGTQRRDLALPPAHCLNGLPGNADAPIAPDQARRLSFNRISAEAASPLRLTPAHLRHAVDRLASGSELRTRILSLMPLLAAIEPAAARAARAAGLQEGSARAAMVALGTAPGRRQPRIVEHMRLIGAARGRWRRFLPRARPAAPRDRTAAAVLRHLGRNSRPADGALLEDLKEPLTPGAATTALDLVLAVALRLPVTGFEMLQTPWKPTALQPALKKALGVQGAPPALDVIGLAAPRTGLSQNFRMTHQALDAKDLPHRLVQIGVANSTPARTGAGTQQGSVIARRAVIWHLNADRIPVELLDRYRDADAYHIGFLLWELDRIPPAHRLALEMLDEIWVPTEFLRRLYSAAFAGPVITMGKGIDLPPVADVAVKWGPGPRYLCAFDVHSSVARKNPLAAVKAFQAAYPEGQDAQLLIKATPGGEGHWGDPEDQLGTIRDLAKRDPRIRITEKMLPFPELLALISSADALVSPHKAEGFGYMPAYAMLLDRPVIATNWSGTRDFCTRETAFPVACTQTRVPDGHSILATPGARWAEVNVDDLARKMREVVDYPQRARARSLRGRQLVEKTYSLDALGARYQDRLQALGIAQRVEATEDNRQAG